MVRVIINGNTSFKIQGPDPGPGPGEIALALAANKLFLIESDYRTNANKASNTFYDVSFQYDYDTTLHAHISDHTCVV